MSEKYVHLKPLTRTGDYKPEPENCKHAFGDNKCKKNVQGGKCPTKVQDSNICGGWQPRSGLPLRSRVINENGNET